MTTPTTTTTALDASWLIAKARAEGFEDAAVVAAGAPLAHLSEVRAAVDAGRMGPLTWMHETLEQRLDIEKRLPWAKSVLVVLASYYSGDHAVHGAREGEAKVSRYAWGQDYHHVLRRRLRRLRKALLERARELGDEREHKCAPFNDVDAVLERAWAEAAGLGFIGKSAMLISRGLGTWTFIGGLVTSIDVAHGEGEGLRPPVTDLCGSCTACLDACPTQAIVSPRVVDARRCLVTWNVEEPDDAAGDAFAGHGWAVGCDVCQEVCPWNKFAKPTGEARFHARAGHVAFTPETAPVDVEGTPLARPGREALPMLAARALKGR